MVIECGTNKTNTHQNINNWAISQQLLEALLTARLSTIHYADITTTLQAILSDCPNEARQMSAYYSIHFLLKTTAICYMFIDHTHTHIVYCSVLLVWQEMYICFDALRFQLDQYNAIHTPHMIAICWHNFCFLFLLFFIYTKHIPPGACHCTRNATATAQNSYYANYNCQCCDPHRF